MGQCPTYLKFHRERVRTQCSHSHLIVHAAAATVKNRRHKGDTQSDNANDCKDGRDAHAAGLADVFEAQGAAEDDDKNGGD